MRIAGIDHAAARAGLRSAGGGGVDRGDAGERVREGEDDCVGGTLTIARFDPEWCGEWQVNVEATDAGMRETRRGEREQIRELTSVAGFIRVRRACNRRRKSRRKFS